MKKKQLSLLLIITFGLITTTIAQFDFKAQFIKKELAPAKTIVILTNDIDPNMDKANAQFEDAVRKYWSATKAELVTKKYSEVKNTKSSEIYFGIVRTINNGLYDSKGPEAQALYTVTFLSCEKENKPQMDVMHPRIFFTKDFDELDIIWAVRILNNYAEASIKGTYDNNVRVATGLTPPLYRLSERNHGKLKTKTLLLDKLQLDKKLDESGLKDVYPYKFKVVTRTEILEAVKSGAKQTAYFQSEAFLDLGTGSGVFVAPVIIDTETGDMLSYSKITGGVMTNQFNPKPALATKGNLKEIVKNGE